MGGRDENMRMFKPGVEGIVLLFSAGDGTGPVYKFPMYDHFAHLIEPLVAEVSEGAWEDKGWGLLGQWTRARREAMRWVGGRAITGGGAGGREGRDKGGMLAPAAYLCMGGIRGKVGLEWCASYSV